MELVIFKSCVYCIYTRSGIPLYIGSTNNLANRFKQHKEKLLKGEHENTQLQHLVHNNGVESIIMVPVFYCEEADLLINEMKFINFIRPAFNNHHNGGLKIDLVDELTKKIREYFAGKLVSFEDVYSYAIKENPKLSTKAVGSKLRGFKKIRVGSEGNKLYYQF